MLPQGPERSLYQRIYDVVRQVPLGQVTTYGRVARMVGGISAQMVGFALAALPNRTDGADVPWQRVINAQGKVSPHGYGFGTAIQRELLESEGIVFDAEGRVDLEQFGW
jgi:methylated-DNA-protein-cysteine methyltransferase-like protein